MGTADTDPKMLVDLAVDGSLGPAEREALRGRLDGDDALRREERDLTRLNEVLALGRVTARPGFTSEVMATLPANAPWAERQPRGWRSALLALAALLALSIGVLGVAGAQLQPGSPLFAAARAIADFAVAAALSGAGLLTASWRGVGMAIAAALDLPATVVFGVGVLAVNALLFALLRGRRRRALAGARARRGR